MVCCPLSTSCKHSVDLDRGTVGTGIGSKIMKMPAKEQTRESGRQKELAQRRVLDSFTRAKRLRRQLEALEQDNFQEDPHANLVLLKKKLPQFDSNEDTPTTKKRKKRGDHFKQRFRKTFHMLVEEEQLSMNEPPNYLTCCMPHSTVPQRKFCAVCGFPSNYTCVACGARYCCTKCLGTHLDTRCLKWTA